MFNAGNSDAGCSKERYRLTDVHQPTTAVVLSTAVPGWPCAQGNNEKNDKCDTAEMDALSRVDTVAIENISDSTVREVLKVIESVDTSFIRHRNGRFTGRDRPSETTELMRLFEDRRTDVFVYDPNKQVKRPTGFDGAWDIDEKTREPILQDVDNVVETKTPRKVKIDSPISAEKSRSLKKQKKKVDVTRVSRGLGATHKRNEHAPSVEDEIRKKTDTLSRILSGFNEKMEGWDCDMAEGADVEESGVQYALQMVKSLNSSILPLLSCGEAFENMEKNVMAATMKHLCMLVGLGSKTLIYEGDEDSSISVQQVEIALGGGVLLSRLILKSAKSMVISEECLEMCVETSRYQLQQNILPFYDARLRAAIRPTLRNTEANDDGDVEMCEGDSNKSKVKIPAILGHLVDRMSVLINLIGDIAPIVHFPVSLSSPLLRVVIQSMTTDYLPDIKNNSVNLVSALVCSSPEIRQKTLEDIFTAMTPVLGSGKKCRRDIQVASENGTLCNVSIMTAIILKITQGCAQIPSLSSVDHIKQAYGECISVADQFWTLCMDRLFTLKTTRMETDADFSCVMLGIVDDMLHLSAALHWPVVATLLIRLVSILNSDAGLRSSETLVRQLCVDLLGKILVAVHRDSHSLNELADHLDEISKSTGYENANEAATEIVLQMLSDLDFASVQSARRFLLLRDLCEQVELVCKSEEDEEQTSEQVAELLRRARDDLERHSNLVYENLPKEEDGKMMMKILVHQQFSSAAPAMLSWILEIMETKQQASTIRAKAVKAIGDILSADSSLLKLTAMHDAIEHALQDDSISVREAALTLVGKHMAQDANLASSLLHVVIKATDDPGASVRRSAIRILKDCAVIIPQTETSKVNDAYRAILSRSTDQEDSVKSLVGKTFKSLWLQPGLEGENGVKYNRSVAERATSMANLVMSVVNASGSNATTRNVLQSSSPLIVLMKDLLSEGDGESLKSSYEKEMHGITLSLLESAVRMSGETTSSTDGILPYLHALYAISVSNVSYCIPESDPMKFLRSLAPYLKMGDVDQSTEEAKIAAEQTLCLLGIITNILKSANEYSESSMEIATGISGDLFTIINQHGFTVVVSSACMCLAACALVSKFACERLFNIAAVYLRWLRDPYNHLRNLARFIFIVGQLYRFGASHFERLPVAVDGSPEISRNMALPAVLKLLGSYWDMKIKGNPALAAQIQRNALEAICQVMIASPLVAMAKESKTQDIIAEALGSTSSPTLKLTALNGLIELVETDSNALHSLQHQDSKLTQRGKKRKSMASDNISFSSRTAVATENGEGDLSHSSSILQNHWDAILALATDIPPLRNSEEHNLVLLRRRILVLMELAQRDGLVGPWSTVPTLVIFSMDCMQEVSGKALTLLKRLSNKYMEYVDAGRLVKGVKDSHFQFERSRNADMKASLTQMRRLYLGIICQSRARRNEFLRLITRSFKAVLVSSTQSKTTPPRTPGDDGMPQKSYSGTIWVWLAHLICGLPFRKTEEVCLVINEIDSMLAFRMSSIVAELHELIESDVPEDHPTVKECGARAKILCLLSRMKTYLLKAYSISAERQAVFASSLKRRGPEDSTPVSIDAKVAKQMNLSDGMLSKISIEDKTSISTLRDLYNELDTASIDQEDAFDPDG